jgi:hypothetical protein
MRRQGVTNPEPAQGRVDLSTFHRHAPELLAVKAITRRPVPWPAAPGLLQSRPYGRRALRADRRLARTPPVGTRTDWRGPIGFVEAWAAGVTQALLDGPLGLPESRCACICPDPASPAIR